MNASQLKEFLKNDFEKIEKILDSIGCHKIWESSHGKEIRCASPNGTNKTSISVKMESLSVAFFSDSHKKIHDIIGLVEHFKGYEFKEAMRYIKAMFGLGNGKYVEREDPLAHLKKHKSKGKRIKLSEIEVDKFSTDILNNYIQLPHYELFKEGIVPQVQEQFSICYDDKLDRVIFPHFNYSNKDEIVGITGRTLADETSIEEFDIPKYWNYIKGYKKTYNFYGFSHAIEYIIREKCMIIFESEKSTLKHFTLNKGEGFAVSVGGHAIDDVQIKIIMQHTPPDTEIVIAFDKDVMTMKDESGKHIGKEYITSICQKITAFRKVSYIYDEHDILGEKSSPIDEGVKRWNYLFSKRIGVG